MKLTHRSLIPVLLLAVLFLASCTTHPARRAGADPGVTSATTGVAHSRRRPLQTDTHRFERITDGVYLAVGTGSIFVQSNSLVIVNRDDVIVVDSHVTPAAARALTASVKTLTDKPIRYLINTHYHFDHAHGNQVFGDGIEIIGHEFTRSMLLGDVLEQNTYRSFAGAVPAQVEDLEKRVTATTAPHEKKELEERLRVTRNHMHALDEVRPTPPDLTLKTSLTIFRGEREIQLLYLGRGHTGGDVVVFLPGERVVFTGDLMLPFLAYMGDAFVDEWPATLEKLKALDFDIIAPGHGGLIRGKDQIGHFQAYLRDIWERVAAMKKAGLAPEEVAAKVDMTDHGKHFPSIKGPGADPRGVARMFRILDKQ